MCFASKNMFQIYTYTYLDAHTFSLFLLITYLVTYSWSRALLEKLAIVQPLKMSQRFMEPEGSLPPSQEPSAGPYPEPDRSNPHHPILSL
jgi:hypothetical protein